MILYASNRFYLANGATVTSVLKAMLDRFTIAKSVFSTTSFPLGSNFGNVNTGVTLQFSAWRIEDTANKYFTVPTSLPVPPMTGPQQLLNAFSQAPEISSYCLGHLFDHVDFSGTVGLAWLGTPNTLGGICEENHPTYGNTNAGFTTDLSFTAQQIYSVNGLVTTHEIGHNMGSVHDTTEGAATNNFYLMYPYSSDGSNSNNNLLSSTSITKIGGVIAGRGSCFKKSLVPSCGNFIVEAGERCDCGIATSGSAVTCSASDSCCSPGCTFVCFFFFFFFLTSTKIVRPFYWNYSGIMVFVYEVEGSMR